ncbi:MAG: hypothetical protein V3T78_10485, partial [Dehalococcoidia bacterium]
MAEPLSTIASALAVWKPVWRFIKWILRLDKKQEPAPSGPTASGEGSAAASGGDATAISDISGAVVRAEKGSRVSVTIQQPPPPQTAQPASSPTTAVPDLTSWIGRSASIAKAFV